ncbi:MAG: NADH-quinone oxidoreductase subunit J [Sediminibacterium sp.]|nr:MAG: NADH-quinone oxidoreductase subunit J [Sediminibacterium sp.]
MSWFVFYFFASVAIFSSIFVVLSKNTVKSVLFLILSFLSTACIWLLLEAEFLAITLILVYVGAVMVLFLFVVMMIDQEFEITKLGVSKYSPLIMCSSLLLLVTLLLFISPYHFGSDVMLPEFKGSSYNVILLGLLLYNKYLFAFEIAGILFLVGMVAAIAISFRGRQDRLNQDVSEQVNVKSGDRLKYVNFEK